MYVRLSNIFSYMQADFDYPSIFTYREYVNCRLNYTKINFFYPGQLYLVQAFDVGGHVNSESLNDEER